MFTNDEVKSFRGIEFTYIYQDGDSVQAFIAEADLTIGLTCKALDQFTSRDHYQLWSDDLETLDPKNYDNVICVRAGEEGGLNKIQARLSSIIKTGKYIQDITNQFARMQTCAF